MHSAPYDTPDRGRPIALLVVFGIIVVAFAAIGLGLRQSAAASFAAEQNNRQARSSLFGALKAQLDEETGIRGYAATRDRIFLQPYFEARAEFTPSMTDLIQQLNDLGLAQASDAAVDAVRTNRQWLAQIATPLLSGRLRNGADVERHGKDLVDHFRLDESIIEDALSRQYDNLYARSQSDIEYIGVFVVVGTLLIVGVGFIFAVLQVRAWDRLARERDKAEAARRQSGALQAAYETEKRIAERFQRALGQREFPAMPSMRFSAMYTPATEEAKVGGDWYDILALAEDRALVVIGDIAGHGIDAAIAMNRVRNAVLAAALIETDVARILDRVNQDVIRDRSISMATASVGIIDSKAQVFDYAAAGHPPPVVVEKGKPPRLLNIGSLPLGVGHTTKYRAHRVPASAGTMVVLYTDGAIERSRDVLAGERGLLDAVATVSERVGHNAAAEIHRAIFGNGPVGDDVAILTIAIVEDSLRRAS